MNRDDPPYKKIPPINQYSIELNEPIQFCDIKSLLKSSETLSFLVRDAAHVTPLNFESCVHAIRAFAEASLNGGKRSVSTSHDLMLLYKTIQHGLYKQTLHYEKMTKHLLLQDFAYNSSTKSSFSIRLFLKKNPTKSDNYVEQYHKKIMFIFNLI